VYKHHHKNNDKLMMMMMMMMMITAGTTIPTTATSTITMTIIILKGEEIKLSPSACHIFRIQVTWDLMCHSVNVRNVLTDHGIFTFRGYAVQGKCILRAHFSWTA
jgi:hypothetical protein